MIKKCAPKKRKFSYAVEFSITTVRKKWLHGGANNANNDCRVGFRDWIKWRRYRWLPYRITNDIVIIISRSFVGYFKVRPIMWKLQIKIDHRWISDPANNLFDVSKLIDTCNVCYKRNRTTYIMLDAKKINGK